MRHNLNTPAHYDELYTSGRYDSVGRIRMARIRKANIYIHGPKVLDVGCGEGAGANWFAEQGYEAFGVDFCPVAIANAAAGKASGGTKEEARQFTKTGTFICHDLLKPLPWRADCFDAATAFEILEHFEKPRPVAQEIMRVLKPGGRLFFTCPKAEFSFELDNKHIQAFKPEDYAPMFEPHKLVEFNDTDWPKTVWGVVEKRRE